VGRDLRSKVEVRGKFYEKSPPLILGATEKRTNYSMKEVMLDLG